MKLFGPAVAIALSVLLAPSASAQQGSLAELAKKSEKEREKEKDQTKVIRSEDLRRSKSRVHVPPASGGAATAPSGGEGEDEAKPAAEGDAGADAEQTPAEQRAALQEQLQGELAQQQDRLTKLRAQIADAQAQLADQTTYYPGNPRRASLEELVAKCNVEIADAERSIADIRRRARARGIALGG